MVPKVSIIVPVYRCEPYISRCIESILSQTFTDFQLILVNDGSPDKSGEICDKYAEKDNRIKVIHQENQGASAARNRGIKEANGEYLMFCDSDDMVSPTWAERLLELADKDTLVMGAYCNNIQALGTEKKLAAEAEKIYAVSDYKFFNNCGIAGFLWNAVYRRDIVTENKISLREKSSEGDYNEDLIFALQYVSKIKNIIYTGYSDYLYDVRSDSMSHSFDKYYFAKYREKYQLWRDFINHNGGDKEKLSDLSTRMLYHFLLSLQMAIDNKEGYKKFKEIVTCREMEEMIPLADTSKENPKIINLIKNKKTVLLYGLYKLQNLKRRCRK